MKILRFALPFLALVLSLPAFAQTTYTVTLPTSGVYSYPFRAFNIPLSSGAQVNWLEVGTNTGCYGQSTPGVGFIYLTLPSGALPCIPLTGSPSPIAGTFDDGVGHSGSYSFVIETHYHCTGGRGGCKTVFTIDSGTVEVN